MPRDATLASRVEPCEVNARIRVSRRGVEVTRQEDSPWPRWCLAAQNGLGCTCSTKLLVGDLVRKDEPILIPWEMIEGWERDTRAIHLDLAVQEDDGSARLSQYVWKPDDPNLWTLPE